MLQLNEAKGESEKDTPFAFIWWQRTLVFFVAHTYDIL